MADSFKVEGQNREQLKEFLVYVNTAPDGTKMGAHAVSMTGSNLIDDQALPTKLTRGELVKVPFREGQYAVENTGSTASYQANAINDNADGTGTGIFVSVPAGSNGVRIRLPFYGRAFGVRWRRDGSACDFSVAIDGVAYGPILGQHTYLNNEAASMTDGESLVVVADDLPDGVHYAEIGVVAPASGSNGISLYGLLLDSRAGYEEKPRLLAVVGPTALATAVQIPRGSTPGTARGVRKVVYVNTTAAPITVIIKSNGTILWQKPVPANDSIEFDFGGVAGINSLITHEAAGGAPGVNATVIGGC